MTRPDPLSWDIDDELDAHLAMRVQDNLARGMSLEDARAEALRRFGPRAPAAAASRRARRHEQSLLRAVCFDLRDAWRAARRAPAVSLSALVVAAIGLGTVFGAARLADSLLNRAPGGVRQPSGLYSMLDSFDGQHPSLMSRSVFDRVARAVPEATPFVWSERDLQVIHAGGSRVATANFVSGAYFTTLAVQPAAGRLLGPDDVATERAAVVVSHRLARAIASSAGAAPGTPLTVNGQPFEVAGVAEPRFLGLEAGHPVDLWLPVSAEPRVSAPNVFPDGRQVQGFWSTPGIGWLRGGLRLPDGVTVSELGDRLTAAARGLEGGPEGRRVLLHPEPWLTPFSGDRDRLAAVIAPVGWAMLCTLLLTGACLGSLYVGRVSDRRQELGLRMALGAGRKRLVCLTAAEIVVVVAGGGAAGVAASELMLRAVSSLQITSGMTLGNAVAPLDGRAAALLALLIAAAAALAAATPAAFVLRSTSRLELRGTRTVASGNRFRRMLMVAQMAAACALLSGAALLTQSITALRAQPLGFDADAVAFLALDPAEAGLDAARRAAIVQRLLDSPLGAGIDIAIVDELPFRQHSTLFVAAEGSEVERAYPFPTSRVGGPYFETIGADVVAGRAFHPGDRGRPVAILSQPLAELFWPGANPVGQMVRVGGHEGAPHEVVGIAAGLLDATLRAGPTSRLYLPFDDTAEGLTILARPAAGPPAQLLPALHDLTRDLDPRLVAIQAGTLDQLAVRTIEQRLLFRLLTALIGLGSLLMVAAGVWGLSHGSLRRRWREFGIRQALGAGRLEVARLALADARFVAIAGGSLGLLAGWQFGRVLESWLFGVTARDPLALGAASLLVVAASIAGAIRPARQAANIDPAELLRQA